MGRNKRSKGGRGVPGMSKKLAEGSRGERLRKREEEREVKRAKKRRKLGKKALSKDKSGGHEGRVKKHANKRRLELARLERLVSKQEELLHDYRPPVHVAPLDPELKRKRRRRDFYDLDTSHWKLTGAARPADSLPGNGGTELINEREDWTPGVDLFKKLGGGGGGGGGGSEKDEEGGGEGGFFDGPEACREFLELNHQLAQALHDDGSEPKTKEALSRYERCMELDPADHVMARRGLVRLLLDAGDADRARAVIDRFPGDRGCELAWSLAAIELVAWSVLEEEGAGEKVAAKALRTACAANPFVAWNVAHREIFDEVVEHADEISDPAPGSVEEAFWYMAREGELWASLEGSSEWVANFLLSTEALPPSPHDAADGSQPANDGSKSGSGSGSNGCACGVKRGRNNADQSPAGPAAEQDNSGMFANMFETAVSMAAEMMEEKLGMGEEEKDVEGEEEEDARGTRQDDEALLSGSESAGTAGEE